MRAVKLGGSAPFVTRRYGRWGVAMLLVIVGLFASAVYALVSASATSEPAGIPAETLAMLLVGFVLLVSSLRARRR